MRTYLSSFWDDNSGFVVSTELIVLFSVMLAVFVVGFTSVRTAVVAELYEVGNAVFSVDQSYVYSGIQSSCIATSSSGSAAEDINEAAGIPGAINVFEQPLPLDTNFIDVLNCPPPP